MLFMDDMISCLTSQKQVKKQFSESKSVHASFTKRPRLSDSKVEGNTRKFVEDDDDFADPPILSNSNALHEDDDDFADSPILSNSNALQRAKTIHKNPSISRMKLKKTLSEAPKRQPRFNGYLAFFAENRPKVCHLSTIVF